MNDYKFTEKWFDIAIPMWTKIFEQYPSPTSILEIGCYEGRATTWLCDNVIKGNKIDYNVIDTFGGSLEEIGMTQTKELLEKSNFIEDNFRHNISFHPNVNFTIYKGYSQLILPTLKNKEYDFIYIDASHRADDTFVDAYFAFKMLKKGGMIIFDDYLWKDPNNLHLVNSPQLGIEIFNTMYDKELTIIFNGYQVGFIKN
jgi:predicted O-methyltransferase YrrM